MMTTKLQRWCAFQAETVREAAPIGVLRKVM